MRIMFSSSLLRTCTLKAQPVQPKYIGIYRDNGNKMEATTSFGAIWGYMVVSQNKGTPI